MHIWCIIYNRVVNKQQKKKQEMRKINTPVSQTAERVPCFFYLLIYVVIHLSIQKILCTHHPRAIILNECVGIFFLLLYILDTCSKHTKISNNKWSHKTMSVTRDQDQMNRAYTIFGSYDCIVLRKKSLSLLY